MVALLEEISKTMLEKYKTSFPEFAEKDPFYFYMNGKIDSKLLINIVECYLQRTALLKCIFPEYPRDSRDPRDRLTHGLEENVVSNM